MIADNSDEVEMLTEAEIKEGCAIEAFVQEGIAEQGDEPLEDADEFFAQLDMKLRAAGAMF